MSLLSRYPLGQSKVRTPFADKTNEDDGEGAFFAQSRKALKKTHTISKPSAKSLPSNKGNGSGRVSPNLVISTTSHPGVSRVISESGVLSPPLNSLLHMHERKVRRASFPKRRSLVELEDVGSLSMSTSSNALDEIADAFKLDAEEEGEKREVSLSCCLGCAKKSALTALL